MKAKAGAEMTAVGFWASAAPSQGLASPGERPPATAGSNVPQGPVGQAYLT